MSQKKVKKKVVSWTIGIIFILMCVIILSLYIYIIHYHNPQDRVLKEAGIVEKTQIVGDISFNYAEGPDNGPSLVLLHAQLLDWYTYNQVLPVLSEYFHVYAIDYPGHGKTQVPENYEYSANQIGSDLAEFIVTVIGEPVYVTGNSSGGLLATWLASNKPELIKAALLEDPPLFSSEFPEIQNTIAYKSFTTSHNAIDDDYDGSFLNYWIQESTQFFKTYTGPGTQQFIYFAVNQYVKANPGEPVEIAFMTVSVQEMIRGLNYYDPAFGNAFYEGTWNEGFSHVDALANIECPVLLLHANYEFMEDGTLDGAMSDKQADLATSLVENCEFVTIDSPHVVNLEYPDEFSELVVNFFLEVEE